MPKLDLPGPIRFWRAVVLFAFYSLLIQFAASSFNMTVKVGATTIVFWFIQTIPLLIFIPSLHRNYLRAYAWLCFVVLIYFIHGVLTAFNPERQLLGLIETLVCTVLFVALVIYIRKYRTHYQVPL
jgi:uncharacterized membrane protein